MTARRISDIPTLVGRKWEGKERETSMDASSVVKIKPVTTVKGHRAGVDFDDECSMNVNMLLETMSQLKSLNKECSYTFLAGWDYNNPSASSSGPKINQAVKTIAQS